MPYTREKKQAKIAAGFCSSCFCREPEANKRMCPGCNTKASALAESRRNFARTTGMCTVCLTRPKAVTSYRCEVCLAVKRADYYRRAADQFIAMCRAVARQHDAIATEAKRLAMQEN